MTTHSSPGSTPTASAGAQTIVIIDDSEAVRFALGEVLSLEGYRVVPAAGGEAGLAVIRRCAADGKPPSLIIVDLVMDDVNGFDVMAAARQSLPDTPILAISGGTRNVSPDLPLELAAQTGAAACLQKPFSNDEFLGSVSKLIGPAGGR